jgi:hypothetical protein
MQDVTANRTLRNSLRPATVEHEQAADLLSAAANAFLDGSTEMASQDLRSANLPVLFRFGRLLMDLRDPEVAWPPCLYAEALRPARTSVLAYCLCQSDLADRIRPHARACAPVIPLRRFPEDPEGSALDWKADGVRPRLNRRTAPAPTRATLGEAHEGRESSKSSPIACHGSATPSSSPLRSYWQRAFQDRTSVIAER